MLGQYLLGGLDGGRRIGGERRRDHDIGGQLRVQSSDFGLLLRSAGIDDLLPLVVFGLALIMLSVCVATWLFEVAR